MPSSPTYKVNSADLDPVHYSGDKLVFNCQKGYTGLAQLICHPNGSWVEIAVCHGKNNLVVLIVFNITIVCLPVFHCNNYIYIC